MKRSLLCGVLLSLLTASAFAQQRVRPQGTTPSATVSPSADAGARTRTPEDERRRATVVATAGTVQVTVGELEDLLNEAPAPIRAAYTSSARQREFLENLVRTALLAQEARRRGLERHPEVEAATRRILVQRLQQSEVLEAVPPSSITDEEVRTYYEAHVGDYRQPELRRATVIVLADRAGAEQVAQQVRTARGDMRRVQTLVRERSVDAETREHEGDLHYFRREGGPSMAGGHAVDPAVAQAAFGLAREMDVAGPVPVAQGRFAVVVLTGIRPALSRELSDVGVANSIRGALVRQRRLQRERALVEQVRERLHPEVHEERLDAIQLPAAELGNLPPFEPGAVPRREDLPSH